MKAVELGREIRRTGTSTMRLRLDGSFEETWRLLQSMFSATRCSDPEKGVIAGLARFSNFQQQWFTASVEDRSAGSVIVRFSISIQFVGRAVDSAIFDRIIRFVESPEAVKPSSGWARRLVDGASSDGEAYRTLSALPLSIGALLATALPQVLTAWRPSPGFSAGVANGLLLSYLFLFPLLAVLAGVMALSVLRRNSHRWVGVLSSVAAGLALFEWSSVFRAVMMR